MKVILLDELKGRGGEGDIVDVRQGYAENYLFPKKIAIPVTEGNLKQLEQRRRNIERREETRIAEANKIHDATDGKTIVVKAKVGEDGQLFGSVTNVTLAEAIQEQLGIEVDRKRIETHGAIKQAGSHEVSIFIYREIRSSFTVKVEDIDGVFATEEAEEQEAAPEADVEEQEVSESSETPAEEDATAEAETSEA